uniref:Uncharacterized protein n=1 Tax=viral metagenome TaxID=1070528 RepID=A0A6C0AFE3_9ZZZZ
MYYIQLKLDYLDDDYLGVFIFSFENTKIAKKFILKIEEDVFFKKNRFYISKPYFFYSLDEKLGIKKYKFIYKGRLVKEEEIELSIIKLKDIFEKINTNLNNQILNYSKKQKINKHYFRIERGYTNTKDDYEVEIFIVRILPVKKRHSDNFTEGEIENDRFIELSKECFRLSKDLLKKKKCEKILICANREERYRYMDRIKIIKRLKKKSPFIYSMKIEEICKNIIYRYPNIFEKFENLTDLLDYLDKNIVRYYFSENFKPIDHLIIYQSNIKTLDDLIKKDEDKFQDFLFIPQNE